MSFIFLKCIDSYIYDVSSHSGQRWRISTDIKHKLTSLNADNIKSHCVIPVKSVVCLTRELNSVHCNYFSTD